MLPLQRTELKPKSWTALLPLALSVFIIFAAQKSKTPFLYFVGGFTALASLVLFWFLNQFRIILDDGGITIKTKISTQEMQWKEITRTYVSQHFNGKRRVSYWNFETAEGRKIVIPLSQHSRKNLKTIADAVVQKCSHAEKDEKIMAMQL